MTEIELGRIVDAAYREGIVVPAFNVPYLPMVKPVVEALVECDAFGLIEVALLDVTKFEARSISAVAEEYRRYADRRCARLHLDHIPVIDEDGLLVDWRASIQEALSVGYESVMIDGSRLSLEENIAVTSEVVRMAHSEGVLVEAELGSVLGHESGPMPPYEELFVSKAGFTKPDEAGRFVRETGVDWLSVSIGSVHGAISPATKDQAKVAAKLDIEHLKRLREAAGIPLVLHGGSGIPRAYIARGIENGIAKINIATDIRQPYERALAESGSGEDARRAVAETMRRILCEDFGIRGSASRLRALAGG